MDSFINTRKPGATPHLTSPATARRAEIALLLRRPLLVCAAVMMTALMSTYVHVLNGQVESGERMRTLGLAEFIKSSKVAQLPLPSQQPVAVLGLHAIR